MSYEQQTEIARLTDRVREFELSRLNTANRVTPEEGLDAILSLYIERGAFTGYQALYLAEVANRFFVQNGHAPAQFSRLKAVRKAGV